MSSDRQGSGRDASQAWVLRSRALLDQSAQAFDGPTLSRLNRARQAALDGLAPERPRTTLHWLGASAVAAGVALMVWQGLAIAPLAPTQGMEPLAAEPAPVAEEVSPLAAADFELLLDAERYALLEELEFYAWLEKAEDPGG
jgi:hypothetical protein